MTQDVWNPSQYERFRDERSQPFFDVLSFVRPRPGMRVVDLGCGTGELTRALHHRLAAGETLGIDSSEAMLEKSRGYAGEGLRFERRDILAFIDDPRGPWDLIFSNAALHWVPLHEHVLRRLTPGLATEGQLPVHVPANPDHPSQVTAGAVARGEPFPPAPGRYPRPTPVLPPPQCPRSPPQLRQRRRAPLPR